ncbi:MAG: protein-L-isoaspartate(D-aspartate) O-methyltransferase [Deltaproteobacteria bacterium]|nr:protein-L-isoaspartate(D-aspartate) O-methyltransferase [Deltaproteobacteria bacterium]
MVRWQLRGRGIHDERVLGAMGRVPRQEFVPASLRHRSYDDSPLPIGRGQTISQPLMVATMLEELGLQGHERVLEVGAGCGYQAALLGELCREVYAIEIIPELAEMARTNLARLGHANVEVVLGDGSAGYPAKAPYDGIIVAAAAPHVPAPLVEQLAPGAPLLIPVGAWWSQVLQRVRRRSDGSTETEKLVGCAFVPLVGEHGIP